jgi:hypothetical protein
VYMSVLSEPTQGQMPHQACEDHRLVVTVSFSRVMNAWHAEASVVHPNGRHTWLRGPFRASSAQAAQVLARDAAAQVARIHNCGDSEGQDYTASFGPTEH